MRRFAPAFAMSLNYLRSNLLNDSQEGKEMSKEYGTIIGRVGIILLLTGIVITLIGYLRSSANTNRIDSSLVTYLGVGLSVVGVILLLIFVIEFVSNKRKHP
jgi:uncharacterized membrane protein